MKIQCYSITVHYKLYDIGFCEVERFNLVMYFSYLHDKALLVLQALEVTIFKKCVSTRLIGW